MVAVVVVFSVVAPALRAMGAEGSLTDAREVRVVNAVEGIEVFFVGAEEIEVFFVGAEEEGPVGAADT
eukprot:134102-Pleurochrysis_carterae.AAC.1